MYKKLKPELLETVQSLKPGDGVVIKLKESADDSDKRMGYVHEIREEFIETRSDYNPKFWFDKFRNVLGGTRTFYEYMDNIKIVD